MITRRSYSLLGKSRKRLISSHSLMQTLKDFFASEEDTYVKQWSLRQKIINKYVFMIFPFFFVIHGIFAYTLIENSVMRMQMQMLMFINHIITIVISRFSDKRNLPLLGMEVTHFLRLIINCLMRGIIQIYLGPECPIYITFVHTLIIITSTTFYFRKWMSILSCGVAMLFTVGSYLLSCSIEELKVQKGVFMNRSFMELQTPFFKYYRQDSGFYNYHKLLEVVISK